jgi:hypothetical protein
MEIERYRNICRRMEAHVREQTLDPEAELPTVRQLARRYRITQALVEQIAEDVDLLGINCGVQIQGVGYGVFDNLGDYTLEWCGDA